jgi:hypothetical protein
LSAYGYSLEFRLGAEEAGCVYRRTSLAATRLPWRYQGVLHEYLDCPLPHRIEALAGPMVLASASGARSGDPDKYRKDALLLQEALKAEPFNSRYVFYLAQSHRDAGQTEQDLAAYLRRAHMGGWAEEVFYARYQAAAPQSGCRPDRDKNEPEPPFWNVFMRPGTFFQARMTFRMIPGYRPG